MKRKIRLNIKDYTYLEAMTENSLWHLHLAESKNKVISTLIGLLRKNGKLEQISAKWRIKSEVLDLLRRVIGTIRSGSVISRLVEHFPHRFPHIKTMPLPTPQTL